MDIKAEFFLSELLAGFVAVTTDLEITGLTLASGDVCQGYAFFALAGTKSHGLSFAQEALKKGAVAVIYDPQEATVEELQNIQNIIKIAVPNLRHNIGYIAARFYHHPTHKLHLIGITGTNGKTSCSHFLGQVIDACAIVGTLGWGRWKQLQPMLNTTPDAITLQQIFVKLVKQKQKYVAMEVSSHALAQGRAKGIFFKGAVITNISRDHLDYHGTMEAYIAAKTKLLQMPKLQYAVLNLDDKYSANLLAVIPKNIKIFGVSRCGKKLDNNETLQAKNIICTEKGIEFNLVWKQQTGHIFASIYGQFNVENLLLVIAVLLANNISLQAAILRLHKIQTIPGRMENFQLGKGKPRVFIDYAHTPDALKNILLGARVYSKQKIWLVFGCGGDRDQGKRALMGNIAVKYADQVIVTDDNPRSENTESIVSDILSECDQQSIIVIHDRELAIRTALKQAQLGDCVVIAGKGHEDYQEIAGQRKYFSDRKLLKTI